MNVQVTQIWEDFQLELKGFIVNRVKKQADADDILQDVFIKIIHNESKLTAAENMRSYLYGMVRNAVSDYFRKQKAQLDFNELPNVFSEEESEDLYEKLAICCVAPFIDQLPEKYKTALIDVELNGVPQKQLAHDLGLSYSAAKSRVQRGREKLKHMILGCCMENGVPLKSQKEKSCDC